MFSAQTTHERTRAAVFCKGTLICLPKTLLSVIRKGAEVRRDFRTKREDKKKIHSLGPTFFLVEKKL
jgi:hypothetical protein